MTETLLKFAPHSKRPKRPKQQRLLAGIIAAAAFAALAVQPILGDGSYLANLAAMVRFFTIWGNIAACIVMAAIALGARVSTKVMAGLATMLAIIGLVYWGLLAGEHHPAGVDRITNQFHHTIVPLTVIVWWLAYTPPSPSIIRLVPAIMAPPLTYSAFALVQGHLTGFYAYFFIDLPTLGWVNFLISNVVLAVVFALLGAGMVAIKNWFNRRS
jgi:hypothetical protein